MAALIEPLRSQKKAKVVTSAPLALPYAMNRLRDALGIPPMIQIARAGAGRNGVSPVDPPAHPESGQPAGQLQAGAASVAAARPWFRIALWWLFAGLMVVATVYAYLHVRSRVETVSFTTVPFTSLPGLEVAPSFSPDVGVCRDLNRDANQAARSQQTIGSRPTSKRRNVDIVIAIGTV